MQQQTCQLLTQHYNQPGSGKWFNSTEERPKPCERELSYGKITFTLLGDMGKKLGTPPPLRSQKRV